MTRIISALLIAISSAAFAASAMAQESAAVELNANAPDRHIVVPGDTLWDISARFANDPRQWPKLWRLNDEQIKNPHRIYPGQVLVLRRGEQPYLEVETVRIQPKQIDTPLADAIPPIPQRAIEPFLRRPLIVESDVPGNSAHIVAIRGDRVFAGPGNTVYVTGLSAGVDTRATFQVVRPGRDIVDPVNKEVLGREAVILGNAKITRTGEPTTFEITNAVADIGRNDLILPSPKVDLINYVPHAPKKMIEGSVASVMGEQIHAGAHSIIALSRGARDGLEVGNVLALYRAGIKVTNRFKERDAEYQLPAERFGLVFIFRVFDRISYALVMEAGHEVSIGDMARTP